MPTKINKASAENFKITKKLLNLRANFEFIRTIPVTKNITKTGRISM